MTTTRRFRFHFSQRQYTKSVPCPRKTPFSPRSFSPRSLHGEPPTSSFSGQLLGRKSHLPTDVQDSAKVGAQRRSGTRRRVFPLAAAVLRAAVRGMVAAAHPDHALRGPTGAARSLLPRSTPWPRALVGRILGGSFHDRGSAWRGTLVPELLACRSSFPTSLVLSLHTRGVQTFSCYPNGRVDLCRSCLHNRLYHIH